MITTQIDDLVGRPTGVKTQAFLYVLCGLAEAAVYVALLPLLRSLIAGDYVAAGYLVWRRRPCTWRCFRCCAR